MILDDDLVIAKFPLDGVQHECIIFSDSDVIYQFEFNTDGSMTGRIY